MVSPPANFDPASTGTIKNRGRVASSTSNATRNCINRDRVGQLLFQHRHPPHVPQLLQPPGLDRQFHGRDHGVHGQPPKSVAPRMKSKRGSPLKLSAAVAEGCDFAKRFEQKIIHVDHHALEPAREHLPHGFTFKACAGGGEAKEERFIRVRDAFREDRIRIPRVWVKLSNQLSWHRGVVSKPKPGGGTSIHLPRRAGTHLDLASAFILAADVALQGDSDPFKWRRAWASFRASDWDF